MEHKPLFSPTEEILEKIFQTQSKLVKKEKFTSWSFNFLNREGKKESTKELRLDSIGTLPPPPPPSVHKGLNVFNIIILMVQKVKKICFQTFILCAIYRFSYVRKKNQQSKCEYSKYVHLFSKYQKVSNLVWIQEAARLPFTGRMTITLINEK